jgi:hypothetical protein
VSCLDLVEGTPVVDIKPYVPMYDSVATQRLKWATHGTDPVVPTSSMGSTGAEDKTSDYLPVKSLNQFDETHVRVPTWIENTIDRRNSVILGVPDAILASAVHSGSNLVIPKELFISDCARLKSNKNCSKSTSVGYEVKYCSNGEIVDFVSERASQLDHYFNQPELFLEGKCECVTTFSCSVLL